LSHSLRVGLRVILISQNPRSGLNANSPSTFSE
jgi:hypothetical protein